MKDFAITDSEKDRTGKLKFNHVAPASPGYFKQRISQSNTTSTTRILNKSKSFNKDTITDNNMSEVQGKSEISPTKNKLNTDFLNPKLKSMRSPIVRKSLIRPNRTANFLKTKQLFETITTKPTPLITSAESSKKASPDWRNITLGGKKELFNEIASKSSPLAEKRKGKPLRVEIKDNDNELDVISYYSELKTPASAIKKKSPYFSIDKPRSPNVYKIVHESFDTNELEMEIISSYELNNELWVDQTDSEVQASKECAKRTITDLLSPTSSVILDTYEVEPNSMEYTSEAHSNTTRYESDEEFKAKPTVLETLLKSKGLKDDKKSRETVVSPINRSINRQQLVSPSNQDFKLINSVVEDSPRRSLSFNDAAHLKEQIKISLDTKVEKCDIRSNTTPLIEKEEVDPTTLIKSKDITEANSNNLVNKKSKEALINPALKRVESPTSAQVDVEEEEIKSPILDETVSKNFKDSRPYDASQGFESFSFSQPTEDDFKPYLKGESILDFESASHHKDLRYRSEVNQEDLNLESGKEIRLQKVDGRNSSDNIIRENIGRLVNEKEIGTVDKSQGSSKDPLNENKVNKFNLENVASSDRKRMGYSMKEGDKKGIIAERIKMFGSEINIKTSTMSKSQPNKESVNFKARPWSPDNNTLSSKINYDGKHSKSDLTLESKVKVNRNKFLENNSSDNINESALKSLIGTVKGWEPELQDQMNKTSSISKGSNNVNKISPLNGSTNETKNHLDQKDLTKETTVGKVKTWEPTTLKSETKIKEDTINNHTMKQKANQSEDCNEVAKVESEVNILTCIEKTNANLSPTTEDSSNIVNPSGILLNMSNPELNMISNSIKNTTNEVSEVKLVKNTNKSNEAVKLPPVGLRRHGATYSKDELVIDRNLLTASKIHQEIGLVDSKKEGPAIIKEATDLDFNSILAEYNNMKISKSPQKIRTTESLGQSLLSTRSDSLKPSQVNNSFVEGRNKNPSYQTRAKSPNRPRCVSPSKGFETIHNEKESKDQQNGQQIEKHDSSENINVADFKLNNIIENNNRNSPSQSYNPKVESVIKENDVEARSSYLNPKSLEPSLSAVLQCIKYLDEKDFENHRYSSALTIYSTMMGSESTDSSPNLEAHIPYPSDNNSIEDLVLNSKQHESPKQRVQSTARKEDYQFPPNNTKQPRISTTLSAFSLPEKKEDISVSPSEASCRSEPLFSHHRKPSSVFTPAPPPKSNLRVNRPHKLIENKGAGSVPPTIKLKSKSLNRKLSDPEMFTMSAMSRNDKNRPNINHNRNYSSRTNDSIGTNGPPLASPSLSLPQRFESLESLRSHSEEMISKSNSESKLIHVVEELISTEVSYREDLILLRDIYMKAAKENPNEFSVKDIHIIFINVEDIIDYSRKLIQLFKINSQEIATLMIGKVIIEEHSNLQEVYSQYFKHHEASMAYLQNMAQRFPSTVALLEKCDEELKSKSKAWDINSLLIKPIQRFLKYPLLLRELLSVTPKDHPDYQNLLDASRLIQNSADNYNEFKKRKEAIEKIIGHKPKKSEAVDIRQGFNKKLIRGAQQLRKIAGIKLKTTDKTYDTLALKVLELENSIREFWIEVQNWTLNFENVLTQQEILAKAYLSAYTSSQIVANSSPAPLQLYVSEFLKAIEHLTKDTVTYLDHEVNTVLYERVQQLCQLFNKPTIIMKKRDRKLYDYDQHLKNKDKENNKSLAELSEGYELINQQLIDELPQFLQSGSKIFLLLVGQFATIQKEVYSRPYQDLNRLLILFDKNHNISSDLKADYFDKIKGFGEQDPFSKAALSIIGPSAIFNSVHIQRSVSEGSDIDSNNMISHNKNNSLTTDIMKKRSAIPAHFYRSKSDAKSSAAPMIDRNNSSPFLTHPGENSYFASSLLNPESRKANELSMDSLMVPGLTSDDMQRIKESLISNFAQGNTDNNNEGSAYDEILKNEIRTSHSTSNLVDPLQSFNMNLSFKQEAFKSHSQISSINHSKTNSMESTASFLLKEHSVKNTLGLNINKAQDGSSIYSETSTEAHSPVNSYSSPKSHAEDSNHLRSHKTRDSISTMQTTTTISSKKERTILFHCKALFPYKASGPTELSLVPGIDLNVFKVTKNSSSPWWYGEDAFSRERGWFPSGYCKRI